MGKKREPQPDQALHPFVPPSTDAGLVVSTILLERGHILMVRQGTGSERGRWNLPGGKADPGEHPVAAAVRETFEETGYGVEIRSYGGAYSYVSRSGKSRLRLVFFGRVMKGEPHCDGEEILDVRWFALDQLRAMADADLAKPHILRPILANLERRVRQPLHQIGKPSRDHRAERDRNGRHGHAA